MIVSLHLILTLFPMSKTQNSCTILRAWYEKGNKKYLSTAALIEKEKSIIQTISFSSMKILFLSFKNVFEQKAEKELKIIFKRIRGGGRPKLLVCFALGNL